MCIHSAIDGRWKGGFPEAGEEGRWKGGTDSYCRTLALCDLFRCFYLRNTKALTVSRVGIVHAPVATLGLAWPSPFFYPRVCPEQRDFQHSTGSFLALDLALDVIGPIRGLRQA